MGKEIIVNNDSEQTRIALVENGELVELFIENPENERTLGDIYLGRVRKIMPSIQAAFVDIGQKQDAFLHYSDLSDNLPELLSYLQDENPEVGKTIRQAEQHRKTQVERRHPHHAPAVKPEAPQEIEPEEVPEAEAPAEDGGPKHVHRLDLSTRSQRRSVQQRAQHKPAEIPEPVAPPPPPPPVAEEDDDEDDIPHRPSQPLDTYLKRDQRILVKIVKEPISAKGSRVSTDISLAGRFLVLVPLANYVAVSKKIVSYKERRRLRTLAKSLLPDGFGLIVRTVAEGKSAKVLDTDLRLLVEKWRKIERKLQGKPEPPMAVHEDVNMVSSVMRDLFSDDFDRILVDDPKTYRNLKNYVQAVAPDLSNAVQQHKGNDHIFAATKIAKEAAQVFESRVDLPSGGYLFIERTEAMHVVDVNSGRSGRGLSQEENSLRVNLEAARVIAKQIRLRDLGGIIVVDFIDLRDDRNRMKVYDELRREFRKDRAVTKLLPMSDFGLVQITRQRLRPSVTTTFADSNSALLAEIGREAEAREREEQAEQAQQDAARKAALPQRGREDAELAGRVSPDDLIKKMEEWVAGFKQVSKSRSVLLRVHPFMGAYLNRKLPNYPTRWTIRHFVRIQVELDDKYSPFAFRFIDRKTGEDVTNLRRLQEAQKAREEEKAQERPDPRAQQRQPERVQQRGPQTQGRGEQRGGPREQGRGEQRNDPRSQPRGEQRGSQPRPETRGQGRPEPRGQGRPEPRREERPQPRPEPRREERGQPQREERSQSRQENRNQPRSQEPARGDLRDQPRGENQEQRRREERTSQRTPRGEQARPERQRPREKTPAPPASDEAVPSGGIPAPDAPQSGRPEPAQDRAPGAPDQVMPDADESRQAEDQEQTERPERSRRRRSRGRGRGRRKEAGERPEAEAGPLAVEPEGGAAEASGEVTDASAAPPEGREDAPDAATPKKGRRGSGRGQQASRRTPRRASSGEEAEPTASEHPVRELDDTARAAEDLAEDADRMQPDRSEGGGKPSRAAKERGRSRQGEADAPQPEAVEPSAGEHPVRELDDTVRGRERAPETGRANDAAGADEAVAGKEPRPDEQA